jgi:DNA-directed RNA polymerase specialized sigma24 family protein
MPRVLPHDISPNRAARRTDYAATDPSRNVLKGSMDTDIALAGHLARDLEAAFPALVAGHQDRLYTIALRLLGDPRDAEEVAQDALVRAYRAMGDYPAERVAALRLRPWLASITVNLARNRRRRADDRRPPLALEPMLDAGFELTDTPAASAPAKARWPGGIQAHACGCAAETTAVRYR